MFYDKFMFTLRRSYKLIAASLYRTVNPTYVTEKDIREMFNEARANYHHLDPFTERAILRELIQRIVAKKEKYYEFIDDDDVEIPIDYSMENLFKRSAGEIEEEIKRAEYKEELRKHKEELKEEN